MDTAIYVIAAVIVLVAVYPALWTMAEAYVQFRGRRVITCPETHQCATVEVDAGRAAISRVLGQPALRLSECSRWPERQNCGQECLAQIEAAPADCLLVTMLKKWYEGKSCVYCGKPLGEVNWLEHRPAARSPEGKTIQWNEVPAEAIPQMLQTYQPVCWNCHVAATFRRLHAELVVDRPPREHLHRA